MQFDVNTYYPATMSPSDLDAMFRLRFEVFHERLGWEVQTLAGRETDPFDDLDSVAYVLAKNDAGEVDACWRILPTMGPNMLADTFPELLHGKPAPRSSDCWELSRFAVATRFSGAGTATFSNLSVDLMRQSAKFALERGIARYVTVTTPAMERLLRTQGLHVHRIGPSMRIGIAAAVALVIEVDEITLKAIRL